MAAQGLADFLPGLADFCRFFCQIKQQPEGPLTEDPSTQESHHDNGRVFFTTEAIFKIKHFRRGAHSNGGNTFLLTVGVSWLELCYLQLELFAYSGKVHLIRTKRCKQRSSTVNKKLQQTKVEKLPPRDVYGVLSALQLAAFDKAQDLELNWNRKLELPEPSFQELKQNRNPINKETHQQAFHGIMSALSRDCPRIFLTLPGNFASVFPCFPKKDATHKQI